MRQNIEIATAPSYAAKQRELGLTSDRIAILHPSFGDLGDRKAYITYLVVRPDFGQEDKNKVIDYRPTRFHIA